MTAVLVVAALAALVGVGLGTTRSRSAPQALPSSGPPTPGGTLTVSFENEPASLDPAVAGDVEAQSIERLLYQTLVTYAGKPGEAGCALVPDLAGEVPTRANGGVSENGRVYTFHLQPRATFAAPVDTRVTAADVKWSLERMLRQPLAPAKTFYAGITGSVAYMDGVAPSVSGLRVVDRTTLRITLDAADPAFLAKLASPFASVLSKAWCTKVGAGIDRRPLGSGPYQLGSWTRDRRIQVVRNPGFAGRSGEDGPWLDEIAFVFLPGQEALDAFRSGQLDVLAQGLPEDVAGGAKSPGSGWVLRAPQLAGEYLFMNVNEKPFNAVNVRRAVSYAIDRERLQLEAGAQGQALDQIYPAGLPGHQAGRHFYGHDPAKAKYLLDRAGYPKGFRTTLYTDGVDPQPALAAAIRRDLAAVGIEVDVETLAPSTYWTFVSLAASRAPLVLGNWYRDFPDPSDWIGPLFDDPVDGGADFSFYQRQRVTSLLEASRAQPDAARRVQQFARLQDMVMSDAPVVPLLQPVLHVLYGEHVRGFYAHPVLTFDFARCWKTGGG